MISCSHRREHTRHLLVPLLCSTMSALKMLFISCSSVRHTNLSFTCYTSSLWTSWRGVWHETLDGHVRYYSVLILCSLPLTTVRSVVPCGGNGRCFARGGVHPPARSSQVGCKARSECVARQAQLALWVHDLRPRRAPAPDTELLFRHIAFHRVLDYQVSK